MTTYAPIVPANAAQLSSIADARVGFITELVWSNDGMMLAVGNGGGVALWRGGFGGEPNMTISAHDAPVKGLAFSPDNQVIATASSDTTARLWVVGTGTRMGVLRGHSGAVNTVAFNPRGTLIATGSADKTVRVLDLIETARRLTLHGHDNEVTAVAFSPDGQQLASASTDTTVRLWQPNNGDPLTTLRGHSDWVRDLDWSADGLLATASRDATVRVWRDGETLMTLEHENDVRVVLFSPDGTLIASGDGGSLSLWDVASAQLVARYPAHDKPILGIAFHPLGNLLVTGGGDNTLHLWAAG